MCIKDKQYSYNEFPFIFTERGRKNVQKQNIQLSQSLNLTCLAESKENEQHSGFMLFISGISLEF